MNTVDLPERVSSYLRTRHYDVFMHHCIVLSPLDFTKDDGVPQNRKWSFDPDEANEDQHKAVAEAFLNTLDEQGQPRDQDQTA